MKKLLPIILFTALLAVSCKSTSQLYSWKGYDDAVYAYTKAPDEEKIEKLIAVYENLITDNEGSRKTPPPGVCADYGLILIQKGKTKEGKELLVRETILYPESKQFIDRILKRFE